MKKIVKNIFGNWKIIVFVMIVIPIFIGILLLLIDYVPLLKRIPGSNGDWLGFWGGYIGAAMGVLGAYYIMKKQIESDKESILYLGIFKKENIKILKGIDIVNGSRIETGVDFSSITMPLINAGKGPIFDIEYSFEIDNLNHLIKSYEKREELRDIQLTNEFIKFTSIDNYREEVDTYLEIYPFIKLGGFLLPNDTLAIHLPNYIQILLTYPLTSYNLLQIVMKDKIFPKFKLYVTYKDANNNNKLDVFTIEKGNYYMDTETLLSTLELYSTEHISQDNNK
ncbi:hypothetical protein [Vagococcus intermedius]|uniref:Uncharacterized protein n=1 Tax=Vagococcus intermedius TaxID=2991418 RepID=A0AAF0CX22_9ENTE|nr:hypothetical protein [Vagococcus intermedius]WEG74406.1 hypothetical protein OL234_10610 [Vagococcus intermedius]WEG76526.1 hypothetical protein OL235_10780 [Vagococcus intermedius]